MCYTFSMKIYVTRHGQTKLNENHLMQGRTDEPLNERGISQAEEAAKQLEGIKFDAVFSSPLCRAVRTASIMGHIAEDNIIKDERIVEFDFGPYEKKKYTALGLKMSLFWALPEVFGCPNGVENPKEAYKRVSSFFEELKEKDYENVLIACHGGIIRVICGYLEGRKRGYKWRPKPKNCEIRIYDL